jgi:hypothetical protein
MGIMKQAAENLVRVPQTFLTDHIERDLPSPEIIRETKAHYFIRSDDPEMEELLSDARHYADSSATDCHPGLRLAARALLKALGMPWLGR